MLKMRSIRAYAVIMAFLFAHRVYANEEQGVLEPLNGEVVSTTSRLIESENVLNLLNKMPEKPAGSYYFIEANVGEVISQLVAYDISVLETSLANFDIKYQSIEQTRYDEFEIVFSDKRSLNQIAEYDIPELDNYIIRRKGDLLVARLNNTRIKALSDAVYQREFNDFIAKAGQLGIKKPVIKRIRPKSSCFDDNGLCNLQVVLGLPGFFDTELAKKVFTSRDYIAFYLVDTKITSVKSAKKNGSIAMANLTGLPIFVYSKPLSTGKILEASSIVDPQDSKKILLDVVFNKKLIEGLKKIRPPGRHQSIAIVYVAESFVLDKNSVNEGVFTRRQTVLNVARFSSQIPQRAYLSMQNNRETKRLEHVLNSGSPLSSISIIDIYLVKAPQVN